MIRGLPVPDAAARWIDPSAPEELRVAAARGALPLAPADRLTALLLLLSDSSRTVREHARTAWDELPRTFLLQAVEDSGLHEAVLDLVAARHGHDSELVLRVLEHPRVGVRTLARFVENRDGAVLERIATNQRVLGRDPGLVKALLANDHLGPDERGRLESLFPHLAPPRPEPEPDVEPEPEDLPEALPPVLVEDTPAGDQEPAPDPQNLYQYVRTLTVGQKLKLAMLGSKGARRLLVKDTNRAVVRAVVQSPKIQEDEIVPIVQDRTTSEEVLRVVLTRKDWLKNYQIRLALAQNPKTPLPRALRLLETLQERDLRQISKSRNVPSQVASGAMRVLARRGKA